MILDEVEVSLGEAEKHLSEVVGRRERLLKETRDVISASSKAIIFIHTGKFSESRKSLAEARLLLDALRKDGSGNLARYLVSPEGELVEASAIDALVRNRKIPSRSSLGVSPEGYILGLLDSVGEMKRLTLDCIIRGDIRKAKRYFEGMESLYSLLSPFAAFDNVVNGTRRKIDVARMLIEDTRGLLAEEARREKLAASMEKLYRRLGSS